MATQVLFDPKLALLSNQTQKEGENTTIDPTFRNLLRAGFLREAMNRKIGDIGWDDGNPKTIDYKDIDLNLDNRVDSMDFSILFSANYPDGTLVRSDADNRFMIVAGTKRRIPNEKTFNNLGLDKDQMMTLSDDELKLIPDGEEIPIIKYDNGTLLKSGNDYYLMAYGLRRKIPDELTFKNLDLDKTKAISVSASELTNITEGTDVPHFEYRIGTILKNAESNDEKYYLITAAGEKKLIKDKKTLESLELDISKVKEVPWAKLRDITDDQEPFPHLEYPNGSILKSGDKYYYTMMDKTIEVPDEITLQAHGLDVKMQTITV